ncbi:MAG: single-stranded DNA-binding protein [Candidatus Sericytochromatia bacterium]|nr:single-stranded DNA-binding protein [Candidatus Sericytochromatia bacterium]
MMLNSVVLVGRAGNRPELRYFESGKTQAVFPLAVDRPRRRDAEPVTDWFSIELWGRQAEVAAEYVRKGSLVGVEGRLSFHPPTVETDDESGPPYIAATNLRLLSAPPAAEVTR